MSPFIIFHEGKHDAIFFQEYFKSKLKLVVKCAKFLKATEEIRRLRSGVLLIDCGGAEKIYSGLPQIMRQMIYQLDDAYHRFLVVGDSDKVSCDKFAKRIEAYVTNPLKAPRKNFKIIRVNNHVKLVKSNKEERILTAQFHLVPNNLEAQIIREARRLTRLRLLDSGTEEERLRVATKKFNCKDVPELIKKSVDWFLDRNWLTEIGEKMKSP